MKTFLSVNSLTSLLWLDNFITEFLWSFADVLLLQIEDVWKCCIKQVYQHHFPNSICSLHISASLFANFINISNFFIIIIICIMMMLF